MITREADYAIRVCLYLASSVKRGGGLASTAVMARELGIPYRFLRKLVLRLVNAGIVASRRGKGGGIRLIVPPRELALSAVVRAFAPEMVTLNACLAGKNRCTRSGFCPVHRELAAIQLTVDRRLDRITFDRLT